ncbi:MAG: 3-dehydroquinate synthase [Clostridia bacterium]|nr:3-dehydroquinate synthase [Clostridia bacterium]
MAGELEVALGNRAYKIHCGPELLQNVGSILKPLNLASTCLVISNSTVADLYWPHLEKSLITSGFKTELVLVPDSEDAKSLKVASELYDAALKAGIDRKSAIIALGGGVVGDLTGFVAATWLRGVPFIQIPTTLLAQVDASVGGKVAVNHPEGKNLIGAFYQPRAVIADLSTLRTLPKREIRAGLAEVIKYGVIADAEFFAFLEENLKGALAGQTEILEKIVLRCCAIKADIVAKDEREDNLRAILNFGHSVGHAVETVTGYVTYRHGEAVAIGMAAAVRLAVKKEMFTEAEADRLVKLIKEANLPVDVPKFNREEFKAALCHDKKVYNNKLHMILPTKLGKVEILPVIIDEVMAVIQKETN